MKTRKHTGAQVQDQVERNEEAKVCPPKEGQNEASKHWQLLCLLLDRRRGLCCARVGGRARFFWLSARAHRPGDG
jgi:hypothetical protein